MISNEWIDEAHGIHSTSRATPYVKYGLHTTGSAKTIVIQVAAVQKERPLNDMDVYLNELLKSRAKQLYDQHVSTCCSEQSEVLGECCAFLEVPVTKFMP
jgi:hypothetical protein